MCQTTIMAVISGLNPFRVHTKLLISPMTFRMKPNIIERIAYKLTLNQWYLSHEIFAKHKTNANNKKGIKRVESVVRKICRYYHSEDLCVMFWRWNIGMSRSRSLSRILLKVVIEVSCVIAKCLDHFF